MAILLTNTLDSGQWTPRTLCIGGSYAIPYQVPLIKRDKMQEIRVGIAKRLCTNPRLDKEWNEIHLSLYVCNASACKLASSHTI